MNISSRIANNVHIVKSHFNVIILFELMLLVSAYNFLSHVGMYPDLNQY